MTPVLTVSLAALGVALVAVTLPVTVELAVLTAASLFPKRARAKGQSKEQEDLKLAVIVPAHNEELLVVRTVESLLAAAAAAAGRTRVVVIAHNCSDTTAARAAEAGAEVLVYDDPAARGKGFALRRGFDYVFGEGADAALILDADSTVSKNLIDVVRAALAGGADAVQCRYDMNAAGQRVRGRCAALALRGFNLIRPLGRQRLGCSSAILGNGFAVRRSVFCQTPYEALSLVEDLEYHIHLVMAGRKVEFLEEATVSADLPDSPQGEATQRSRWEGGRFAVARQWIAPLIKQVLRGRARLLEPLLDLAALPIAYNASVLAIALLLPLGWLRIYAAAALAILALHVLAAARAGGNFWSDLRLLGLAPAYIAWKLRMIPRLIRKSAANAEWVRTERAPAVREL